ncbi:MAG: hypothetical protein RRY65_06140 [Pseudoflavonifractor sp.]
MVELLPLHWYEWVIFLAIIGVGLFASWVVDDEEKKGNNTGACMCNGNPNAGTKAKKKAEKKPEPQPEESRK